MIYDLFSTRRYAPTGFRIGKGVAGVTSCEHVPNSMKNLCRELCDIVKRKGLPVVTNAGANRKRKKGRDEIDTDPDPVQGCHSSLLATEGSLYFFLRYV